jgi:hypothetical protein
MSRAGVPRLGRVLSDSRGFQVPEHISNDRWPDLAIGVDRRPDRAYFYVDSFKHQFERLADSANGILLLQIQFDRREIYTVSVAGL